MDRMKKLEQEVAAGENAVYGKPASEAPETQPEEAASIEGEEFDATVNPDDLEDESTEQEEVITQSREDSGEPAEQQKEKRVNWKKRFINFKAASDVTIHGVRLENTGLRERNSTLVNRVAALEAKLATVDTAEDIYEGVFSEEEEEILGKDAIAAFKRAALVAAKAEAEPLRKQLEDNKTQAEKQEVNRARQDRQDTATRFLTRLETLCPEYDTIDKDPAFAKYMQSADPASGLTKEYIFRKAHNAFDVRRVADFFNEFKQLTAAKVNPLAKKITPRGAAGVVADTVTNAPMSIMEINKFYIDVSKGRYDKKVKLRDQIEQKIDAQIRAAQQG